MNDKCGGCEKESKHAHLDDDGDAESGPNPNAELIHCCGSKLCCPDLREKTEYYA